MTAPGVWLGVDPGEVRIGVAVSDNEGTLAVPVQTLQRDRSAMARLVALIDEHGARLVVVGLPRSLSGNEGPAAARSRVFAAELAAVSSVPVRLIDERLTTVSATRQLQEAGRTSRKSRQVVDQAAAVLILQTALDARRSQGDNVGELVPRSAASQS